MRKGLPCSSLQLGPPHPPPPDVPGWRCPAVGPSPASAGWGKGHGGGRPGERNGEERNTGPCGRDTHAWQRPQPLKPKARVLFLAPVGAGTAVVLLSTACSRLAAPQLRVAVPDSHKTASEPRFHGPHRWGCHTPTQAVGSHAGDFMPSSPSVTRL